MANLQLPFDSEDTHYEFKTTLQGAVYTFEVRWNTREQAWYTTIKTEDEEIIVADCKIVADWFLFLRSRDARLPPGLFATYDTSGRGQNPGINDLGTRVQVVYVEKL